MENEGSASRIAALCVDAVGVFCNTLLIIVMLVDPLRVLRRGAWFAVLNLAIADLIAGASNFIHVGLAAEFEVRNKKAAIITDFFWMLGTADSFMFLTLLTVQTYIIVRYPIRSRFMLSPKNIGLSCVLIWSLAAALGVSNIPYALLDLSLQQCMKIYIAQIAFLELVVLIQLFLKGFVISEIIRSGRTMEIGVRHHYNAHKEIAKTIVLLNLILFTTVFPFFVAKQIEYLYKIRVIRGDMMAMLFSNYFTPIAMLNFALNPILYSLRLPDYRRSLLALLRRCRPESSKPLTTKAVNSNSSYRAMNQQCTEL